jgi:hypothetical protein
LLSDVFLPSSIFADSNHFVKSSNFKDSDIFVDKVAREIDLQTEKGDYRKGNGMTRRARKRR